MKQLCHLISRLVNLTAGVVPEKVTGKKISDKQKLQKKHASRGTWGFAVLRCRLSLF